MSACPLFGCAGSPSPKHLLSKGNAGPDSLRAEKRLDAGRAPNTCGVRPWSLFGDFPCLRSPFSSIHRPTPLLRPLSLAHGPVAFPRPPV